jgi:excisionase family DNA binding protein
VAGHADRRTATASEFEAAIKTAGAPSAPAIEPLLVSIDDAAVALDCSRRKVEYEIAAGNLEAVKDGRHTKVTVASIRKRAAGLPRATFRPRSIASQVAA